MRKKTEDAYHLLIFVFITDVGPTHLFISAHVSVAYNINLGWSRESDTVPALRHIGSGPLFSASQCADSGIYSNFSIISRSRNTSYPQKLPPRIANTFSPLSFTASDNRYAVRRGCIKPFNLPSQKQLSKGNVNRIHSSVPAMHYSFCPVVSNPKRACAWTHGRSISRRERMLRLQDLSPKGRRILVGITSRTRSRTTTAQNGRRENLRAKLRKRNYGPEFQIGKS